MSNISNQAYLLKSLTTRYPQSLAAENTCQTLAGSILSSKIKDEALIQLINQCAQKMKRVFSQTFTDFKNLSLIHFTAIANRVSLVEALYKKIPFSYFKDSDGNTPLHIRAMVFAGNDIQQDPFVKKVLEICQDKNKDCASMKNNNGVNFEQLYQLTQQSTQKLPSSIQSTCFDRLKYSPYALASQKTLLNLWLNLPLQHSEERFKRNDQLTLKTTEQIYDRFRLGSIPLISLQPAAGSSSCVPLALTDIEPHQIIAELGGKIILEKNTPTATLKTSLYYFPFDENEQLYFGVSSDSIRSAFSFILDGPPNCYLATINQVFGLPKRVVAISLGVKKGEALCHNYGLLHSSKYTNTNIVNLNNLKELLKNNSEAFTRWAALKETIIQENTDSNGNIDYAFSQSKSRDIQYSQTFDYIISTPAAAFQLIQEGLISRNSLKDIISKIYPQEFHLQALYKGHLFNMFLLASIREILEKNDNLDYFNSIVKIIISNYSRAMNACKNYDHIGRILFIHHHLINLQEIYKTLRTQQQISLVQIENMFKTLDSGYFEIVKYLLAEANPELYLHKLQLEFITEFKRINKELYDHHIRSDTAGY